MASENVVFDDTNAFFAHGVLEPKDRDTFFVSWDLIGTGPAETLSDSQNSIFVKERVLGIAKTLLDCKHKTFCITIGATEPLLHPYCVELLTSLFGSEKSVSVLIKTQGLCSVQALESLLSACSGKPLALEFTLTAGISLDHVSQLIACANSAKIPVSLRLGKDAGEWTKALAGLREQVAYMFLGDDTERGREALPSLIFPEPHCYTEELERTSDVDPESGCKNFFCCLGLNFLYIAPNGQFAPAANGLVPLKKIPLWSADDKVFSSVRRIVQCRDAALLSGPNRVLPKFRSKDAASAWMQMAEAAAQTQGAGRIPQNEDRVRLKMRRLAVTQSKAHKKLKARSAWVEKSFPSICRLFKELDSKSQDVLLRVVKALETGDARYLPLPGDSATLTVEPGFVVFTNDASARFETLESEDQLHVLNDILSDTCDGIDAYCEATEECCSALYLQLDDADFSVLKHAEQTLRDFQPRVVLKTTVLEHALTVSLWLKERMPQASLTLRRGTSPESLVIAVEPAEEPAEKKPTYSFPLPVLSLLVYVGDEFECLNRCVESILVQGREDIELILLHVNVSYDARQVVAPYLRRYPASVRSLTVETDNDARAEAFNAGLSAALGEYVAFVEPHEMISWQFLPRTLDNIQSEHPDILIFDRVFVQDGEFRHYGVEPGTLRGQESLAALVQGSVGPFALSGYVFKKERLTHRKTRFGSYGVHADLAFLVQAHLYSRKTSILPEAGCFRQKASEKPIVPDRKAPTAFAAFAEWFTAFSSTHGLDESIHQVLAHAYTSNREQIVSSLQERAPEDIQDLMASSSELFCHVLCDYALLSCVHEGIEPSLPPEIAQVDSQDSVEIYADRETPNDPVLSVLLFSTQKTVAQTLESILSQDLMDFECLVIDDGRDAETYELLQDYADLNPQIRLFRMPFHYEEAVSFALDNARGRYLLFLDAGDICLPQSLSRMLAACETKHADLVSCGTEEIDAEGFVVASADSIPFSLGKLVERTLCDWNMPSGIDRDTLLDHALANALSPSTLAFCGFQHRQERGDSLQYTNLTTLCHFFANLKERDSFTLTERERGKLARLLQILAAFWQTKQRIPLSQEACNALAKNPLFVRSIVTAYGELVQDMEEDGEVLPTSLVQPTQVFDVTGSVEPYVSLFTRNVMPSSLEIRSLKKKPELFQMFLAACAKHWCEKSLDLPTLDELQQPKVSLPKPSYLIPRGRPRHSQEPIVLSLLVILSKRDDHVDRCLQSIATQESVEVICVDDRSEASLSCFERKDSRIRFFRTPWPCGIGEARNLALSEARGTWVLFLEPNDWLCGDFLSKAVPMLREQKKVDLVEFSSLWYKSNTALIPCEKKVPSQATSGSKVYNWLTNKSGALGLIAKVIRKDVLKENNISLPNDEFFFLTQLYATVKNTRSSTIDAVCHVFDEVSPSAYPDEETCLNTLDVLVQMHGYLREKGFGEDSDEYRIIFGRWAESQEMYDMLSRVYLAEKLGQTKFVASVVKRLLVSNVLTEHCVQQLKKMLDKNNVFEQK